MPKKRKLREQLVKAQQELEALRQPVDSDAWKTPLEAYCCDHSDDKLEIFGGNINSIGVAMWRQHSHLLTICLSPADAARVAPHLASYAAAHGYPVALPAPETRPVKVRFDVTAEHVETHVLACEKNSVRDRLQCAMDYLAEHAPWLHTPTGWECDVTADEAEIKYLDRIENYNEKSIDAFRGVIGLIKSRIRPTFGPCKECEKWEAECRQWRNANNELVRRATSARAALEGE